MKIFPLIINIYPIHIIYRSRKYLQNSIKLLDESIYNVIIERLNNISTGNSTTASTATKFLNLIKELQMADSR
jgi:hypothetical protein